MIRNIDDLKEILSMQHPIYRTELFDVMQANIPDMIRNTNDLRAILFELSADQASIILKALESRWPELIKNGHDLWLIFNDFPKENNLRFHEILNNYPLSIIHNADDLSYFACTLTNQQLGLLFHKNKEKLNQFLKKGHDCWMLLKVPDDKKIFIYQHMKERIVEIGCRRLQDLKLILYSFHQSSYFPIIFDDFKGFLPKIITSKDELNKLLRWAPTEYQPVIKKLFANKFAAEPIIIRITDAITTTPSTLFSHSASIASMENQDSVYEAHEHGDLYRRKG